MNTVSTPERDELATFADSLASLNVLQLLEKGRALLEAERPHEAVVLYRTLLERDEHCLPAYLRLADLLERADQWDAARKVLQRGVAVLPDEVPLWKALVTHALRQRQGDWARLGLQHLDRLAPNSATTLLLKARYDLAQGHLQRARHAIRHACEQVLATPPSPDKDATPAPFDIETNARALWPTLTALHDAGVHAFPCFGTLLGLERDGHLMPHDKDMDLGLPFREMDTAVAVMQQAGWTELSRELPLTNPRSLRKGRCVIDLFGFIHDEKTQQAYSGIWMRGLDFHDNMVHRFAPIQLTRQRSDAGLYWQLKDPETFLTTHYGQWRQVDPAFASFAEDPNATGMTPLREYFVWTRIIKAWQQGKYLLLQRYLTCMRRWQPDDPLLAILAQRLDAATETDAS